MHFVFKYAKLQVSSPEIEELFLDLFSACFGAGACATRNDFYQYNGIDSKSS